MQRIYLSRVSLEQRLNGYVFLALAGVLVGVAVLTDERAVESVGMFVFAAVGFFGIGSFSLLRRLPRLVERAPPPPLDALTERDMTTVRRQLRHAAVWLVVFGFLLGLLGTSVASVFAGMAIGLGLAGLVAARRIRAWEQRHGVVALRQRRFRWPHGSWDPRNFYVKASSS